MPTQFQNKLFSKIPLRFVLIVPFVIQIALIVGLVGYLSFRNGQKAVNNVAHQLRSEITARIQEHLYAFLATPHHINQINANAIRQGLPDANDPAALERYLWEQIQVFNSVTSIYFGNTAGGLVDAGREGAQGSLYVIVTDEFKRGPFRKYATDSAGKRAELLTTLPDFDARTRAWYVGAVEKGAATWSDVYILFTGQDMAVAASQPVYDKQDNLLGVVSTDIFASHISDFMSTLKIGETGSSFIMERSGLLVASSTDEKPFTAPNDDAAPRRLYASESTIPTMRYAAEFLTAQFGDYHHITGEQQFEFNIEGQRQFLQISTVQDAYGIDWLVVVVIPESDFMGQIEANNRTTALLIGLALVLAVGAGIGTARWITGPMARLNASTRALAQGKWDQAIGGAWISEIDELAQSFNEMVLQLKQTLEALTSEIAERKQAAAALLESEARLRAIGDNLPAGQIYQLRMEPDGTSRFTYVSAAVERLHECTVAEVLQDPTLLFRRVVEEDIPDWTSATERAIRELSLYDHIMRIRRKSGEIRWHRMIAKPRLAENGAVLFDGIDMDITKQKLAEDALRQSKRDLEAALAELQETQEQMRQQERLAAVGQLAAGVAHDFNNILSSITLYTQMSLRIQDLSPTLRNRLEVISEQADHAADLVQQMLDFSRRAVIERQPLAMDAFLEAVVQLIERTLPENVRVELLSGPGEYVTSADPARVQQVMVNLALNARDAMPDGGKLHIALAKIEGEDIHCVDCGRVIGGTWVRVTVQDSGTGIPPEVLPHIFEPFFTTRAPLGHGLGLAQVYGIVKKHDGHIEVATEIGRGTTFKLYWPALPV